MVERLKADASPEKRLFISLLTRDIPLIAAFLDLIDNSVNAPIEPAAHRLRDAAGYNQVFLDDTVHPVVDIKIIVSSEKVTISDNATGISAKTAEQHVFKFGRAASEEDGHDRLSVYGIGLKRAIFKLGREIAIRSDHAEGGFDLQLNVDEWAADPTQPWTFPLTTREPIGAGATGTSITISRLNEDTIRRLSDGLFVGQLRENIARTYAFYMSKYVNIYVNSVIVEQIVFNVGANSTTQVFSIDGVSCAISAAIAEPQAGVFRDRTAGWFVFCNGRNVIYADKTPLTGWSTPGTGLPIFQPKHRPFVGTVFFVSEDPEKLPWTTTKSGINEDSAIWQEAKRRMVVVGRDLISFLDSRYTDEGTEVATADLREAAQERVSLISTAISNQRTFQPPRATRPQNTSIQFSVKIDDIKKITDYLRRSMSNSDVGRHTFFYFLRNEVGEK